MIRRTGVRAAVLAVAGVLGIGTMIHTAVMAQESDSKAASPNDKKVAAGEREAKKLLLLMDKDKSGKVSKQEFMSFMEEEFARLDKNHDGQLDVSELSQAQIRGFSSKRPGGR